MAYTPAHTLQNRLRDAVHRGGPETLVTLEHDPPVFTLGRNASRQDITAAEAWRQSRGIEIHESNRGGQVTYHGPGQLVAYPILNLDPDRRDIRRYVGDLERVIMRTLADVGVASRVREEREFIGVWTGPAESQRKIASIGVHLARWVTTHGFALNVSNDLDHFGGIVACGLGDVTMTSIATETGRHHDIMDLAARVAHHMTTIFARHLEVASPQTIGELNGLAENEAEAP